MLQFGASLTDDTSSVYYDRNMFIIQATDLLSVNLLTVEVLSQCHTKCPIVYSLEWDEEMTNSQMTT